MFKILLLSIGLALVFEGLLYFFFAKNMNKYIDQLSKIDPMIIKNISAIIIGIGVCLIYFILRTYE